MRAYALLLFVGYLATGIASTAFVFHPEGMAALWLPSGLALVALTRSSRRHWLPLLVAIVAAEVLICTYLGRPWPVRIGWGIADALESLTFALLFQQWLGERTGLGDVADVLAFMSAAISSSALSGFVAAIFSTIWLPSATFLGSLGTWVVGHVASQLSVGALGLSWVMRSSGRLKRPWRVTEASLLTFGLVSTSLLVFGRRFDLQAIEPWPYLVFPFVVWAALRFGVRGASAAHTAVALIASFLTVRGLGPFALSAWSNAQRVLALELFFAVNMLMLFLAAAVEAQHEALLSRDRFLGLAAHELRTPLTVLRINLRLLRARVSPGLVARTDISIRQVQKLSRLTEDLLDISKIARGKLRLEPQLLDLAEIVRGVCMQFPITFSRTGSEIELHLRSCPLVCDAHLVEQLVRNLVENAVKYGEGRPISIRTQSRDESVVLCVTDHGSGIAQKDQARVFEPYERAASELLYPGLGLGLYLCRRIAEAHGGTISLQSELGEGTEVRVELPKGGLWLGSAGVQ